MDRTKEEINMRTPKTILEWNGWRLVYWQENLQCSSTIVERSCLETKYTDRLGEPSWRDASEYEAAFKSLACAIMAGTVKIKQHNGLQHISDVVVTNNQDVCTGLPTTDQAIYVYKNPQKA